MLRRQPNVNFLQNCEPVGVPVLSLYVNLEPEVASEPTVLQTKLEQLLEQARAAHSATASNPALDEDINRVRSFFSNEFSPRGMRAVAIFSAAEADLFAAVPVNAPVPELAVVDERPFVEPLLSVSA